MSQSISFNGVTYVIPDTGDETWGTALTSYLVAIPQGCLQKVGGNFTLSADVNFGGSFGLLSKYFSTRTALPSTVGLLRLAVSDSIGWKNNAGGGNLLLAVNGSDQLTFNGTAIYPAGITALTGDVTATGPGSVAATIANNAVSNAKFRQSAGVSVVGNATASLANVADITAGTDHFVLLRSGTSLTFALLVNANIDPAAAIVDTKLATISTALKVSNSATTATSLNTASAIVARDGSGNFSAGTISAALTGTASLATAPATGTSHGVVTLNSSAQFQSVAPSTARKVLMSDGTDWASTAFIAPTQQRFTSGTAATYTTPAGCIALFIRMVGGGGGGGGSVDTTGGSPGAAGDGGTTLWKTADGLTTILSAGGGIKATTVAGGTVAGGAGGAGTINSPAYGSAFSGSQGGSASQAVASVYLAGANGGGTFLCPSGGPGGRGNAVGVAAITNSGAGGGGGGGTGGASTVTGAGGGSGAVIFAWVPTPSGTYTYTIGALGSAGTGGASAFAGGAGAAGYIEVNEFYQ